MSPVPDVESLLPKKFQMLSNTGNRSSFSHWVVFFEPIAKFHGVWGLYRGTDSVLEKPVLADYVHPILRPDGDPTAQYIDPDYLGQIQNEDIAKYKYWITLYNTQLAEWKENDKLVRLAQALLRAAVNEWAWPKNMPDDPRAAFLRLQ